MVVRLWTFSNFVAISFIFLLIIYSFSITSSWLSSMSIYTYVCVLMPIKVKRLGDWWMTLVKRALVCFWSQTQLLHDTFKFNKWLLISCNLRLHLRWLWTWHDNNNSAQLHTSELDKNVSCQKKKKKTWQKTYEPNQFKIHNELFSNFRVLVFLVNFLFSQFSSSLFCSIWRLLIFGLD